MAAGVSIPKEQRSFADHGELSLSDAAASDRRDRMTGARSACSGDADINLKEQGRFGNLNQNLTAIRNVQDR